MVMVKQVIVIRKDLGMRKGKMIAQGAHASMKVFLDRPISFMTKPPISEWLSGSFTKIVVYVNSEDELLDIYNIAVKNDIPTAIIKDAGKTEFKEPTYTAIAIGPYWNTEIDKITGHLPLL